MIKENVFDYKKITTEVIELLKDPKLLNSTNLKDLSSFKSSELNNLFNFISLTESFVLNGEKFEPEPSTTLKITNFKSLLSDKKFYDDLMLKVGYNHANDLFYMLQKIENSLSLKPNVNQFNLLSVARNLNLQIIIEDLEQIKLKKEHEKNLEQILKDVKELTDK